MLTDVLGLVSAGAYSRTMRLKEAVRGLCAALGRPVPWDLELAVMLSQIGYVVLPGTADDDGSAGGVDARHAELASDLLGKVPRMESVAAMVRHQADPAPADRGDDLGDWPDDALNRELLRVAVLFDALVADGRKRPAAIEELTTSPSPPPTFVLRALGQLRASSDSMIEIAITADQLVAGMELSADLMLANGSKLAGAGTALTSALIGRVQAFAVSTGVDEPIHVLAPATAVSKVLNR